MVLNLTDLKKAIEVTVMDTLTIRTWTRTCHTFPRRLPDRRPPRRMLQSLFGTRSPHTCQNFSWRTPHYTKSSFGRRTRTSSCTEGRISCGDCCSLSHSLELKYQRARPT